MLGGEAESPEQGHRARRWHWQGSHWGPVPKPGFFGWHYTTSKHLKSRRRQKAESTYLELKWYKVSAMWVIPEKRVLSSQEWPRKAPSRVRFQQVKLWSWVGRKQHPRNSTRTQTLVRAQVLIPVPSLTSSSPWARHWFACTSIYSSTKWDKSNIFLLGLVWGLGTIYVKYLA